MAFLWREGQGEAVVYGDLFIRPVGIEMGVGEGVICNIPVVCVEFFEILDEAISAG